MKEIDDKINEIENYILDIDTIMQDPQNVESAVSAINKVDELISEFIPSLDENTPRQRISRLELCAYTLSKLADKAQEHLDSIKSEALKLRKAQKSTEEYTNSI